MRPRLPRNMFKAKRGEPPVSWAGEPLTAPEFAKKLDVHVSTLYDIIRRGEIRGVKAGLIPASEADRCKAAKDAYLVKLGQKAAKKQQPNDPPLRGFAGQLAQHRAGGPLEQFVVELRRRFDNIEEGLSRIEEGLDTLAHLWKQFEGSGAHDGGPGASNGSAAAHGSGEAGDVHPPSEQPLGYGL